MKYLKSFNNEQERQKYIDNNFRSPHLYLDEQNRSLDYEESYTPVEYISSTKTGGQYIDLGCKLFENTDDIIIDIKFNLKGGGKNYELDTAQKPSVLLCAVSEMDPYYAFVLRKNDQQTNADDSDYVHLYAKWQISNSVYKAANGDKSGKYKYYATYLAGNISDYDQTPTNQVYEKTIIIDNLNNMGQTGDKLTAIRNLPTYMFATICDAATLGSNKYKGQMWRFSESDVYYCKITKGNTVVRDLIPVLYKGKGALYDRAHKKFNLSQGDSDFVAGPVIQ